MHSATQLNLDLKSRDMEPNSFYMFQVSASISDTHLGQMERLWKLSNEAFFLGGGQAFGKAGYVGAMDHVPLLLLIFLD